MSWKAGIVVLGTAFLSVFASGVVMTEQTSARGTRILVHVATGPENATRAALAFLVARTAIEEGHSVSVFLAGDAVQLLRQATIDSLAGIGTGSLKEHYAAIVKGGGRFYLSGMSSKSRGLTDADLEGKPAEFASPQVLVRLAVEHDRVFTY